MYYNTREEFRQDVFQLAADGTSIKTLKKIAIKKRYNSQMAINLRIIKEDKRAYLIDNCATFVNVGFLQDGTEKVVSANFCRQRLCSVCAWRRQLRFIATTLPVLESIGIQKQRYIFLTLTVRNCAMGELKQTVDKMLKGWTALCHMRPFKRILKGYIRSLEVTFNNKTQEYHPHIHALIAVPDGYFDNKGIYLNQFEIQQMWQFALNVTYDPIIDVRAVDENEFKGETDNKPALEVMKYAFKLNNIEFSPVVTQEFHRALMARRLITFGGIIKKKRAEFNYPDLETEDTLVDGETDTNQFTHTILHEFTAAGWQIRL